MGNKHNYFSTTHAEAVESLKLFADYITNGPRAKERLRINSLKHQGMLLQLKSRDKEKYIVDKLESAQKAAKEIYRASKEGRLQDCAVYINNSTALVSEIIWWMERLYGYKETKKIIMRVFK